MFNDFKATPWEPRGIGTETGELFPTPQIVPLTSPPSTEQATGSGLGSATSNNATNANGVDFSNPPPSNFSYC